jgi:NAD(P)-dependent dehydrogenase (short-subunit alcohol dehydrogenase family)
MSTQQLTPRVTAAGSGIGLATGFELASRGQLGAANIEPALERNRAFAAARGYEGAVAFPHLRLFVITCLDPRVDPAHFLGLGLSDAMVVRNIGGRAPRRSSTTSPSSASSPRTSCPTAPCSRSP